MLGSHGQGQNLGLEASLTYTL